MFIINVCWHLLFFHYFLMFMLAPISSPVLTGCWALLSWRLASSSPSTAMIRCRYTKFMYSWLSVLAISCICTFQHILSLLNYATFSGEEFLCLTFSVPQYYVRTLHGRGSPGVTGRVRKIALFRYCWPSYWVWTQDVQDENTQQLDEHHSFQLEKLSSSPPSWCCPAPSSIRQTTSLSKRSGIPSRPGRPSLGRQGF